MMVYVYWLTGLSLVFLAIERLRPRHQQAVLRDGIWTDAFYLIFNGHWLGVGLSKLANPLVEALDHSLDSAGLLELAYLAVASGLPAWAQFLVALFVIDLAQWCIHNLLHRVPILWEFHKVHHSIQTMDWAGSMRFHWVEVVFYKSLSYPLLALLGFDATVLFALAVVGTAIGHFNHANLSVSIGPLKYLFNSPQMHIWHHVHGEHGPINRNFGINLSLWDWLFGTAYLPDELPKRLGFEGIEGFPATVPRQLLYPVVRGR